MAGKKGRSGRPRKRGEFFRIDVRFDPGRHSGEMLELLRLLAGAEPGRRGDILDAVARGREWGSGGVEELGVEVETAALFRDFGF